MKKGSTLADPQKKLLEAGLQWVTQNLKCEEIWHHSTPFDVGFDNYHPVMESCHVLDGVLFGRFEDNNSLEMILDVTGGGDLGAHGTYYEDQKYILCRLTEKGFSASYVLMTWAIKA